MVGKARCLPPLRTARRRPRCTRRVSADSGRVGAPLNAGAAEDSGLAMARAADRDHATKQLEVAFDVYAAHGASADALRIARHLNSLGVHRRVVRQRAHTGWDSLTESELRVFELVADGATNRDAASELCVSPAHHQHPAAKRVRQARHSLAGRVDQARARRVAASSTRDAVDGSGRQLAMRQWRVRAPKCRATWDGLPAHRV